MEFSLGNEAQQTVFQLMRYTYNLAKLTEQRGLLDLAMWMAQSDNLHLIQWYGRSGPEAEASSSLTPHEWWSLGSQRIIHEQQQVYLNLLNAMEPYLPARATRRYLKKKSSVRTTRAKRIPTPAINTARIRK